MAKGAISAFQFVELNLCSTDLYVLAAWVLLSRLEVFACRSTWIERIFSRPQKERETA